jgi:polysaccharide export outer membrane protein
MKKDSLIKIFLVDDDHFSMELNKQHLQSLGYTDVSTFSDGQTCLNHLMEQPAVVFVDHMMEPMDGLTLLRKIKRFDQDILIVFISGQEDLEVAVSALKYGAFDYIIKGDDQSEKLAAVMHKVVTLLAEMKMQQKKKRWFGLLPVALLAMAGMLLLTSCAPQNILKADASIKEDPAVFQLDSNYQYRIRKDDKVSISVWDHDDLSVGSIYGIYNSNEVYGKWLLVDINGNISVPQVGEVHAAGMSVVEMEDYLRKSYGKFIKTPIVEVKVLNREVSVIGEVKSPGKFLLEKERYTLIDALSRAGDFDFYANRSEVKVVRNVDGQPKSVTVNLSELKNYSTSNIYLQPGDVVYVPSRKVKVWDKRAGSVIIPATAIITTALLVVSAMN